MTYQDAKIMIEWIEKSGKPTPEENQSIGWARDLILLQRRLPPDLAHKLESIYARVTGGGDFERKKL